MAACALCTTSHCAPTVCIQLPMLLTSVASHSVRNSLMRNGAQADEADRAGEAGAERSTGSPYRNPPGPKLAQRFLAAVVDQQAVRAQPDPRRAAVGRQRAVVHEVAHRDVAGDLGEVSDQPPMAAPP